MAIIDTPRSFWRMLSSRNFAFVDLFFCLLIVAYVFFPSTLSQTIDPKTLGILGAVAFVLLLGARGVGAFIIMIIATWLEKAAKNSSSQTAAVLNYFRNTLITFLVSYMEGIFWGVVIFLPLYALFWFAGNPLEPAGKQILTQIATEAMQPFESSRIVHFPDATVRLAFFSIALFFTAASYFALFALKKWNISLVEISMKGQISVKKSLFTGIKYDAYYKRLENGIEWYNNWLKIVRNEE